MGFRLLGNFLGPSYPDNQGLAVPLIRYFIVLHYMFGALYVPSRFLGNERVQNSILLIQRSTHGPFSIDFQTECVLAINKKTEISNSLSVFYLVCQNTLVLKVNLT